MYQLVLTLLPPNIWLFPLLLSNRISDLSIQISSQTNKLLVFVITKVTKKFWNTTKEKSKMLTASIQSPLDY